MKELEKSNITLENKTKSKEQRKKSKIQKMPKEQGITLVALVITILYSYDEKLKFSNSKGFLLQTI